LDTYNLIWIDNMPEELPETNALSSDADENTGAFIWSNVGGGATTIFSDTDGDDEGDFDNWIAGINSSTAEVLLVQDCHKFEVTEFTISAGTVTHQTTDDLLISLEDESEKRLWPLQMLVVHIDGQDPDEVAAIAQAAFDSMAQEGQFASMFRLYVDVLSDTNTTQLAPAKLAKTIAQTKALCVPEVVALGGGDDIFPMDDTGQPLVTPMIWPGERAL
jgi:hypothetical protein